MYMARSTRGHRFSFLSFLRAVRALKAELRSGQSSTWWCPFHETIQGRGVVRHRDKILLINTNNNVIIISIILSSYHPVILSYCHTHTHRLSHHPEISWGLAQWANGAFRKVFSRMCVLDANHFLTLESKAYTLDIQILHWFPFLQKQNHHRPIGVCLWLGLRQDQPFTFETQTPSVCQAKERRSSRGRAKF